MVVVVVVVVVVRVVVVRVVVRLQVLLVARPVLPIQRMMVPPRHASTHSNHRVLHWLVNFSKKGSVMSLHS